MTIDEDSGWLGAHLAELLSDTYGALVLRHRLRSLEGRAGGACPGSPGEPGEEKLPGEPRCGCTRECTGWQAGHLEPLFSSGVYASLVPQLRVTTGGKTVSLLEVGHRAAAEVLRCVALHDELKAAVRSLHIGDALPMASLAPTALLLGVWNERDTRATAQRVLAATTRALDWGRAGHPARSAPGEASQGDLRQATTLHLAALRSLRTRDVGSTALLQEYLLGLALVALTAPSSAFLRPGCILVPAEAEATTVTGVAHDGARHPLKLTHEQALAFAIARAKAFGVAGEREWMADEVAA